MRLSKEFPRTGSFEEMWRASGGFYQCPKDGNGNRLGPMVGYNGTYEGKDGKPKHYIGDAYFNFATVEELPHIMEAFAETLATKIEKEIGHPDWVLAAPLGGMPLTQCVARMLDCRYLYAEKKVLEAGAGGQRERSELFFGRHPPASGTWGVGMEDTFNNFATTGELMDLITSYGASLRAMAGALNRSQRAEFEGKLGVVPVISVLHIPTPQYRQDDPSITEEEVSRVVWKPKAGWGQLMAAMDASKGG